VKRLAGQGIGLCWPILAALFVATRAPAEPAEAWAGWLDRAEAVLARTDNYQALFHNSERDGNRMGREDIMLMKFRKPFGVYLRWVSAPGVGTEVLYVDGWNRNRLRAHQGGLFGLINFNLDPHGQLAMGGHGHAITEAGLDNFVHLIGDNIRRGLAARECTGVDHGPDPVYGRRAEKVEAVFPRDLVRGYYAYRAFLWIDAETSLPIRTEIYDFQNRLFESYAYEGLILNAGLTDQDFDPHNPAYRF
jgi:hypothetical protein